MHVSKRCSLQDFPSGLGQLRVQERRIGPICDNSALPDRVEDVEQVAGAPGEPVEPSASANLHGDKRLGLMGSHHVACILGALKPYPQRNMLKALRGLMAFAMAEKMIGVASRCGVSPTSMRTQYVPAWYSRQSCTRAPTRHG